MGELIRNRFARVPIWAASAKLSPQAWQVLTVICGHIDRDGWAWPSLATIAALTGMGRKNVPRIITALEDAGLLHRERGASGRGNPTRYKVVFKGPETSSATEDINSRNSLSPRGRLAPETPSKTPPKRPQPLRTEHIEQKESLRESARACESVMKKLMANYPSRGDNPNPEKPARLELEAALARGVDPEDILAGAARYAAQVAAQMARAPNTDRRFVPMLRRWLAEERWKDQPRPVERRRPVAGMA